MLMLFIRKYIKSISIVTLIFFLMNVFAPSIVYATDGPKQPEVKTFTPVSTQDMVDLFTGNFNYNIPLLDVGGYPINLSYNASPGMEQDASWVGLGWNINPGTIDRNMRGIPDDFSGDSIVKVRNKKINQTMGVTASFNISDLEVFGLEAGKLGLNAGGSLGVFRNNYTGSGSVIGLNVGLDLTLAGANKDSKTFGLGANASSSSEDGLTVTPSISYSSNIEKENKQFKTGSFALGASFNTEQGWKELSLDYGIPIREQQDPQSYRRTTGESNGSSSFSFAQPALPPVISMPTFNMGLSFTTTFGGEAFGLHAKAKLRAHYSQQSLKDDVSLALPLPDNTLIPGFIPGENLLPEISFDIPSLVKENAKVVMPAYGYLYAHNVQSEKVLQDFNREKEGPFTIHRPNLPIPNFTHDIYSVTGQGISGMYRPFRNDIGILHDPHAESSSTNIDLPGLEIGGGNAVHVGLNMSVATSNSTTRKWNNTLNDVLGFHGFDKDKPDYQPYYFKQAGEKTADFSGDFFHMTGGFSPVRVMLDKDLFSIVQAQVDPVGFFSSDPINAVKKFKREKNRNEVETIDVTANTKPYRQPRNQDVQFLNANEAKNFAVEKVIKRYSSSNQFIMQENGTYKSVGSSLRLNQSTGHLPHHISEISALRVDGTRYVYGIPVYSKYQKDVSFAIECPASNLPVVYKECERGMVNYTPNADNTTNNRNGIDHHFESEETPAYPHSFLLTSVLSDDFVDITDDGPSDDDLGSYTKFNYTRISSQNKWRSPFNLNTAHYAPGFNADRNDGRASYSYGERELWYMHSIVTKTHVAEFILANREDGIAVEGEQGGPGSGRMKKLIRIDLYAKPDKLKEVKSNGLYKAVPMKSVHFVYDYTLCKGIPNNTKQPDTNQPISIPNEGGKLTLKKVFFTYQKSNKSRLSPYEFEYGYNPDYFDKAQDRWGTYKPHPQMGAADCEAGRANTDFPYADQNKTNADLNASAWNLSKIIQPSSAVININYESDDYAYVQDKPAMQMFTLAGISDNINNLNNIDLYETPTDVVKGVGKYLFFKLERNIHDTTQQAANNILRDKYLKQMAFKQQKLYFKCFANMNNNGYDYVPGYADIDISGNDGYGAFKRNSSDYNYGYIKIKGVKAQSASDFNPITKSAINLAKMNLRMLLKDESDRINCGNGFGDDVKDMILRTAALLSALGEVALTYDHFVTPGIDFGKNIRLHKSMIRLFNPYQNKLGGGSRVKSITISDEWNAMTGNTNSTYGQQYVYTKPDGMGGVISSGVAAYEPIVGGEENPFRQPVFFDEERLGVPDEEYFLEEPMGESFFPAPSVGYSRVTVREISLDNVGNISFNKSGKVSHEFYTAYDFPTHTDDTQLDYKRLKPGLLAQILKVNVEDYVTVSQGYAIEQNDMHGKNKSQNIYQESIAASSVEEVPMSSVAYIYKTDPATGQLDNNVLVMNRTAIPGKNEFIENRMVGVDYDFITDFRENVSSTKVVTLQGNLETFFAAIFPILIPIVLPELQQENVTFRSAVTSKVIYRYGLLEKTITQDLGKQDTVRNLLYDAETGEVLLTQNKNSFDDPVYVFNYPAHFVYEGMGSSYKNSGLLLRTASLDNISGASSFFTKGDELLAYNIDSAKAGELAYSKGWVDSIASNGSMFIIDKDGFSLKETSGDGPYVLKVLRSGRRNLQSNSVGKVVSLKNPLVDNNNDGVFETLTFDKVLDVQSTEYDHKWKIFCNCEENKEEEQTIVK